MVVAALVVCGECGVAMGGVASVRRVWLVCVVVALVHVVLIWC